MNKLAKLLIALGLGLAAAGIILWWLDHTNPTPGPKPYPQIDTAKYTDVVLINASNYDSVQVFVTLQSQESVVGLFGMDSSNIFTWCGPPQTTQHPCIGTFWAKRGVEHHLGSTKPLAGVIVTWGAQNQACPVAQLDTTPDGKQLFPFGINNFEFTVNTWWQDSVLGANESFDITCVDGLHSILQQTVTSFGPRVSDTTANFGAFWDFGYKDSTAQLVPFFSSMNGPTLDKCVNIPGVFPYGCDWGYRSYSPPTPCNKPKYEVKCSTKWGEINTSQTNRPGQGGRVTCELIGFTKDPQPAAK
jgi:hypothetical protein